MREFFVSVSTCFGDSQRAAFAVDNQLAIGDDQRTFAVAPLGPLDVAGLKIEALEFIFVEAEEMTLPEHRRTYVIAHILIFPKHLRRRSTELDQCAAMIVARRNECFAALDNRCRRVYIKARFPRESPKFLSVLQVMSNER